MKPETRYARRGDDWASTSEPGYVLANAKILGSMFSGVAVHIGARIAAPASAGEVLVSGTVHDLVAGSGLRFEDRGLHVLKGVPGGWRVYAVDTN